MAYTGPYSSSPVTQGNQGPQGATQVPKPQIAAQQYRAPQWKPAPGSTGQNLPAPTTPGGGEQQAQMANPGSPVMADGTINPQAGVSAAAPQRNQGPGLQDASAQQPQPAQQAPTSPDPFQAMGGGVWTGQQWVPRNHPLAGQPGAQQPGAPPTGAQPNPALYSPYGAYPGRPEGTVYQPGQLPQFNFSDYQTAQFNQQAPAPYNPGQVSQFNAPNLSPQEQAQWQAIQQVLNNPGLGDTSGLKEQQKELALQMQNDALSQNANRAAASGRSGFGGVASSNARRIGDATQGNILESYRGIDIANAERANADRLAAAGMAESAISGRAGRAQDFYRTGLTGQLAQEDLNLQGANSRMQGAEFNANQQARQADENARGFEAQFKGPQFMLESMLKQEGLNQAGAQSGLDAYNTDLAAFNAWKDDMARNKQLDLQGQLGNRGLDIDDRRLTQQGTQFDKANQLDWASLMNNAYLGRAGLGLNYAQLQQNGQNSMQNFISQILGGGG
jgi:hypothetical protein